MKKASTKNNIKADYIPQDFRPKIVKLTWLLSIWLPLISVSLLSMITSFVKANFGIGAVYDVCFRLTDACAQLSFFGVVAVLIVLFYIKDKGSLFYAVTLEFSGLLIVSFGIKILVLVIMALLDETALVSSIGLYFSDYTLSTLIDSGHIYEAAIIAFLSVLVLAVMLGLAMLAAKLIYNAQKKRRVDTSFSALRDSSRKNPMNPVFAVVLTVYALYALVNEAVETYRTVYDMDYAGYAGIPNQLSEYVYLITPYIYVLLYTICGYYVLRFIASFCTAALVSNTQEQ